MTASTTGDSPGLLPSPSPSLSAFFDNRHLPVNTTSSWVNPRSIPRHRIDRDLNTKLKLMRNGVAPPPAVVTDPVVGTENDHAHTPNANLGFSPSVKEVDEQELKEQKEQAAGKDLQDEEESSKDAHWVIQEAQRVLTAAQHCLQQRARHALDVGSGSGSSNQGRFSFHPGGASHHSGGGRRRCRLAKGGSAALANELEEGQALALDPTVSIPSASFIAPGVVIRPPLSAVRPSSDDASPGLGSSRAGTRRVPPSLRRENAFVFTGRGKEASGRGRDQQHYSIIDTAGPGLPTPRGRSRSRQPSVERESSKKAPKRKECKTHRRRKNKRARLASPVQSFFEEEPEEENSKKTTAAERKRRLIAAAKHSHPITVTPNLPISAGSKGKERAILVGKAGADARDDEAEAAEALRDLGLLYEDEHERGAGFSFGFVVNENGFAGSPEYPIKEAGTRKRRSRGGKRGHGARDGSVAIAVAAVETARDGTAAASPACSKQVEKEEEEGTKDLLSLPPCLDLSLGITAPLQDERSLATFLISPISNGREPVVQRVESPLTAVALAETCLMGEFLAEVGAGSDKIVEVEEAVAVEDKETRDRETRDKETGEVKTLKVIYELEGDRPTGMEEEEGCEVGVVRETNEAKDESTDDSDEDELPDLVSDNSSQTEEEDQKQKEEEGEAEDGDEIDKDEIWSVVDGPDNEGHMHSQDVALLMGKHPKHGPAMDGRVTVAGLDEWIVLGSPQEL